MAVTKVLDKVEKKPFSKVHSKLDFNWMSFGIVDNTVVPVYAECFLTDSSGAALTDEDGNPITC